jgi:molybdopterin synthase catalytic subunit
VPVTEASIVIAISSAHRKESLEAVHQAIDAMKATVPIWKKEVYEESSESTNKKEAAAEWKSNQECFWLTSKKEECIVD